jgi:hypothetical protein
MRTQCNQAAELEVPENDCGLIHTRRERLARLGKDRRLRRCSVDFLGASTPVQALFLVLTSPKDNTAALKQLDKAHKVCLLETSVSPLAQ